MFHDALHADAPDEGAGCIRDGQHVPPRPDQPRESIPQGVGDEDGFSLGASRLEGLLHAPQGQEAEGPFRRSHELLDEGFPIPWLSVTYHFGKGAGSR